MTIINLFQDKLDLTPKERTEVEVWINKIEESGRAVNQITNVSGGGTHSLRAGNVDISFADGVTLRNPTSGKRTVYLDPDGDVYFGSDIDNVSNTSMVILSNAQTYNGEAMGAGDVLLGDNSGSKANLFWDNSTGQLQLRTGTSAGIILDTDGTLQSGNYSAGASGWIIEPDGDAEFNNIVARGSFRTSVFTYENVLALAGSLAVSKSAGEVATQVTTAASFTLEVKTDDAGGAVVATSDILEIKGWNGTALIDVYVTCGTVTTSGGVSSFTATLQSGGTGKVLEAGMAVVNLGQSGAGQILMQAGDVATPAVPTRMTIRTHAGSPWTTWTNLVVLGDLYGTYDTGSNHRYGAGIGDYDSGNGNFLTYNADGAGTFRIQADGGQFTIDNDGVHLVPSGALDDTGAIKWENGSDQVFKIEAYGDGSPYYNTALIADLNNGEASNMTLGIYSYVDATYQSILKIISGSGSSEAGIELTADSDASVATAITMTADIVSLLSGTDLKLSAASAITKYDGDAYVNLHGLVRLTTPRVHTGSWNGHAKSSGSGTIDLQNATYFDLPSNISHVLARIICRDSASWGTNNLYFSLGINSTYDNILVARPYGNDVFAEALGIVPVDSSGDIRWEVAASGSSTMDCWIEIWGYWV